MLIGYLNDVTLLVRKVLFLTSISGLWQTSSRGYKGDEKIHYQQYRNHHHQHHQHHQHIKDNVTKVTASRAELKIDVTNSRARH